MNKTFSLLLKVSIAFLLTFTVQSAHARNSCTYEMVDGRTGWELGRYHGFSYHSRFAACDDARWQCQNALVWQRRYNPQAYCRQAFFTPAPVPPRREFRCSSDLRDRHGRFIRQFVGFGNNQGQACMNARRSCSQSFEYRRTPGAYCTSGGFTPPRNPAPAPRPAPRPRPRW